MALVVAQIALQRGADALAAGAVLGVGAHDDALDVVRDLAVRPDAVVEVEEGVTEVRQRREAHAVIAHARGSIARCGEGRQPSAIGG